MPDMTKYYLALDRGKQFLGLLGSFWSTFYGAASQVGSYTRAINYGDLQTYQDLMELVACTSRFDVPIYHRKNWSLLTVRQNSRLAGKLAQYGSGIVFGNDPGSGGIIYKYGVSPDATWDYSVASDLRDTAVIVNRLSEPSIVWIKGVDFTIDLGTSSVRFREDPFNNSLIPTVPVYTNGEVVDNEIQLWLFQGDYDWKHIYDQFAYGLNIYLESSENYRTLVNLVIDAIGAVPTRAHLETSLALLTDSPLSIEATETIEDIYTETSRLLIVSDQHVYIAGKNATPVVTVGQKVPAGSRLVDAYQIFEPFGIWPSSAQIPAVTLGPNYLLGTYTEDIVFHNKLVPLKVTTDANSRTRVEFELGGQPLEVKQFWDTVHANGTAQGAISLAQLLDSRYPPAQTPDPTGAQLPQLINPMEFLFKHVIRNNAVVVKLNSSSFGAKAQHTTSAKASRQLVPPSQTIFIVVFLALSDTVLMNGAGTSTQTGYTETLTSDWTAPDVLSEASPHSFISSDVFTFSQVDG